MPPVASSSLAVTTRPLTDRERISLEHRERQLAEWNDAHSAELNPQKAKEKHKFTHGKGCAELNTDRFDDAEKVESDNWVGGFYMEVYVDGWDVDKTITLDFHTPEIEFPKHACQNVRVVGYSETTVTLVVVQQRWICCESFGCALRGEATAAASLLPALSLSPHHRLSLSHLTSLSLTCPCLPPALSRSLTHTRTHSLPPSPSSQDRVPRGSPSRVAYSARRRPRRRRSPSRRRRPRRPGLARRRRPRRRRHRAKSTHPRRRRHPSCG